MNGEFLRNKLQSFNCQLVDVAKKLGVSPQNLQSKLKSKDVTVNFLLAVVRAINKNVYDIVSGSEYEKMFDLPEKLVMASISEHNESTSTVSDPGETYVTAKDELLQVQRQLIKLQNEKIAELNVKLEQLQVSDKV